MTRETSSQESTKRKYPSWGDFLKNQRSQKYRSAREFCSKLDVGISYPQYSRYEAGEQLPNLDQALRLCRLLQIPPLEGILEWCLAQIGEADTAGIVSRFLGQVRVGASSQPAPAASETILPSESVTERPPVPFFGRDSELNDVFTFNRLHRKLFESDSAYRDVFTYVNSFSPDWVSTNEIARAMGVPVRKVEEMLENLSDYGVLLLAGGRCRAAKKLFYFPDDEEFFKLRNENLQYNVQKILEKVTHEDLVKRRAGRVLLTRELTEDQVEKVIEAMEALVSKVAELPETDCPERIYSFAMLLGERFSRPSANRPGLRTESGKTLESSVETART